MRSESALRIIQIILALTILGVGAFILGGGGERFASPTYAIPRNIMPWYAWSVLFISIGVGFTISAAAQSRLTLFWSFLVGSMFLFFAFAIALSIVFENVNPEVPIRAVSAPIPAYVGLGLITIFTGVVLQWETAEKMRNSILSFLRRVFRRTP